MSKLNCHLTPPVSTYIHVAPISEVTLFAQRLVITQPRLELKLMVDVASVRQRIAFSTRV